MSGHFSRTLKAYSGALVTGIATLALSHFTGAEADPDTVDSFYTAIEELAKAGGAAIVAWLAVYFPSNKSSS